DKARQAAVEAGADSALPDAFNKTDELYNSLKKRSEAGENVNAALADVALRFKALEEYAKAEKAKEKIDNNNFAQYDNTNYDKGNNAMADFRRLVEEEPVVAAQLVERAGVANISYNAVLFAGFKKKAQEERTAAFVSKRNADNVYAGVSQKERYNEGVENFRNGDKTYALQNPEKSYEHYAAARKIFDDLYEEISLKRAEAQRAIDEAKAKLAESAEYALQADKTSPLEGDNIKGIEDANAVLLDEETYEDPNKAVQDVAESVADTVINAIEAEVSQ
ncbi:MAG: hypothetical protein IJR49_05980, partial [Treponema sp.]|nr:hypothetical protein [Treponema sp.]